MYCQFCGAETRPELNYCNRCGRSLNSLAVAPAQETRPAVVVPTGAVWGIGLTTFAIVVFGIIAILNNLFFFVERGMPPVAVVWIALFCSLVIMGSVSLLVYLWSKMLGVSAHARERAGLKPRAAANELPPARVSAIPEAPGSITEHTTRTFDPVRARMRDEG